MNINLTCKNDLEKSLKRLEAWFKGATVDRPPIRFSGHNVAYSRAIDDQCDAKEWERRWFDTEQIVDNFINSIANQNYIAETFPVFWPNLGPDVYSAFYGNELTYGEVTSWSNACVKSIEDADKLKLDMSNKYFRKIEELMLCAIDKCDNRYFVGFTDLHPGMDCVLAWRGPEPLCFDLLENQRFVNKLVKIASNDFTKIYDHFDNLLKEHGHPSATWMEVPIEGKFHIPSCDFATMMSPEQFQRFALPSIKKEISHTTHNVFHLDGKGVAKNLDAILNLPEISAIQWVQGVGDDEPIMQWISLIRKVQRAGKGVMVNLRKEELEDFIDAVPSTGMFLCIHEPDREVRQSIVKRITQW